MDEFPIVTICGSMRFFQEMVVLAGRLTRDGWIVLAPFVTVQNQDSKAKTDLDAMHRAKIDLSSEIVVVTDENNYVGDSTRSEIEYAKSAKKPVTFYRVVTEYARV